MLGWFNGICRASATLLCLIFLVAMPSMASAQNNVRDLPIYMMVRSLLAVQDEVAKGDLGSLDMQRFLLNAVDERLRGASYEEFSDTRNADAAMIFAMSGGNPETLDLLIQRDVVGYFDNRITSALQAYLSGKGSSAKKLLNETVPEYRSQTIGPYLALVAANSIMQSNPAKALEYFDWARLALPGTIVEEAALRRSLFITVKEHMLERSKSGFRRYFQRFPLSPYSGQVADLLVDLLSSDFANVSLDELDGILQWLESSRQIEVYLRVARRAAIDGNYDLVEFASNRVLTLAPSEENTANRIANLYLGLAKLPRGHTEEAKEILDSVNPEMLAPTERRLLNAVEFVLDEVLRLPEPESLTQAEADIQATMEHQPAQVPESMPVQVATENQSDGETVTAPAVQPVKKSPVDNFIADNRTTLEKIDAMLAKEGE